MQIKSDTWTLLVKDQTNRKDNWNCYRSSCISSCGYMKTLKMSNSIFSCKKNEWENTSWARQFGPFSGSWSQTFCVVITTDGTAVNITMFRKFGCSFKISYNKIITKFKHPTQNYYLYAILDPCQMLDASLKHHWIRFIWNQFIWNQFSGVEFWEICENRESNFFHS